MSANPADLLLPYQRRWADDESRFKIGLMARQVGKDFSSGFEGIRDCQRAERLGKKTTWLVAAPSERQSLESLEKWKEWAEIFGIALARVHEERENPRNSESLIKSSTITFPGGSRVIAVPGKPNTVRGFSANVLATEFAFFEDPDATWRALLPSITNPLRGGQKKFRVISTPNGQGNKFHALWSANNGQPDARWSCHRVTIANAVADGLPIDIEELRAALSDPDGWAQEYDPLDFIDSSAVLLPYDLIALCESPNATTAVPPEYWNTSSEFPIDLGIDFGRKKDMTCCVAAENLAGVQLIKEVLELHKMPTPEQVERLRPRIRKARRACLDYQGPGIGLGDYLVKEFGEYNPKQHRFGKIELCNFTMQFKCEVFPRLKTAFEHRKVMIPINRTFREDLHSVYRCVTDKGNITYMAPHTDDGHADRCTGLALCVRAGATQSAILAFVA